MTASRMQLRATLDHRAGHLPDRAEPDDIDRLLLAYEELASNGLRHGAPPVVVEVTGTASGWLIDVTDAAPEHGPRPAIDRDPAEGGLGLYLIAGLSTACGWSIDAGRKHVWACIQPA
ncbi:ATP-binding protein [Blastococcus sp. CCUG 61487]|uniref:ATP-binding protein n=1 Tax=Blastococcus sp. CCUG 61487 TaxID=1840703 RepID=UPI00201D782D|nr:ATP-binding protein [Blastococcus sp. CCUG 61487]